MNLPQTNTFYSSEVIQEKIELLDVISEIVYYYHYVPFNDNLSLICLQNKKHISSFTEDEIKLFDENSWLLYLLVLGDRFLQNRDIQFEKISQENLEVLKQYRPDLVSIN